MGTEYDEENKRIRLCCGSTNCPTLSMESGKVRIDDDYGNYVLLDQPQASLFQDGLILLRAKTQYKKAVERDG